LQLEGEFTDFVEESGSAVGFIKETKFIGVGACVRPLTVTEKVALHQRADERRAIDDDETAFRFKVVNGLCYNFLAGTGLP
jgi:hypothetical protein